MKLIDASQAWFWTPEWQEGERQADAEIAAGLGERFRALVDPLRYPEGGIDEAAVREIRRLKARMEAAAELQVPLVVDCGVGANWDQAH